MNLNRIARIIGAGYMLILVLGVYAHLFVRQGLVIPGNAGMTANNIISNEGIFRGSIVVWLVVLLLDVIIVWALYVLLKTVHKELSMLTALFRITYITVKGAALVNLLLVLGVLSGASYLTALETKQLHAQAMIYLEGDGYGFLVGLFFFGVHLILAGFLLFHSSYIPKILSAGLMIAGIAYITDTVLSILIPGYSSSGMAFKSVLMALMFLGELPPFIWLLFKGVKTQPAA
ncbi:MAG TPA: DUF4386 domain-containing protein [Ignavibacteriales bacterium]|nr:DUF4386 domain-containing protein [Ignavibacteriales bacterium]